MASPVELFGSAPSFKKTEPSLLPVVMKNGKHVESTEDLPVWIEEAGSYAGLAQIMEDPAKKAAFCEMPDAGHEDGLAILERIELKERNIFSYKPGRSGEDLDTFFDGLKNKIGRYVRDDDEYMLACDAIDMIAADAKTLLDAFSPEYKLLQLHPPPRNQSRWHKDPGKPNRLMVLRTYLGGSTEYSLNRFGSTRITPADGSVTVHRNKAGRGPWHRKPPSSENSPRFAFVMLLEKTESTDDTIE